MSNEMVAWVKQQKPEEVAKYIEGIRGNSVVSLGTDEAFVLKDKDGEIRAFKQRVTLTAANGGLIQPVPGGPWCVSAQGYEILSEASGANCIFPTEIFVSGKSCPNPYTEKNEKGKAVAVHVRAIAYKYSSKGIPVVSDWTTSLDLEKYRNIDFLAKVAKFPQAFRWLPAGEKPTDPGTWAEYPFDGDTSIWVNTSHQEAVSAFKQIMNREKKAVDVAQTFAKRNAMKHLLGIQKTPDGKPHWDIPVLCWRPTTGGLIKWDHTTYANLREKTKSLSVTGDFEVRKGNETETMETVATDDTEEFESAIEPEFTSQPSEPADEKIRSSYIALKESLPDEFDSAVLELKISQQPTLVEMQSVIKNIEQKYSGV